MDEKKFSMMLEKIKAKIKKDEKLEEENTMLKKKLEKESCVIYELYKLNIVYLYQLKELKKENTKLKKELEQHECLNFVDLENFKEEQLKEFRRLIGSYNKSFTKQFDKSDEEKTKLKKELEELKKVIEKLKNIILKLTEKLVPENKKV